jgi:hypothetical protein
MCEDGLARVATHSHPRADGYLTCTDLKEPVFNSGDRPSPYPAQCSPEHSHSTGRNGNSRVLDLSSLLPPPAPYASANSQVSARVSEIGQDVADFFELVDNDDQDEVFRRLLEVVIYFFQFADLR